MSMPSKNRLVIALDFGTTFSGVAFAYDIFGKTEKEVCCIKEWPGLRGKVQAKVPTLIMYDEKDSDKPMRWGGQVAWSDPAIRAVKLMLDDRQSRPADLPKFSFDVKNCPHSPVDVASHFLRAIYTHAEETIKKSSPQSFYNSCPRDFVLTAAKEAGIHPVTLIKEPEAAALYTLTTQKHAIMKHDAFVLCDAGGGTVDLITYEIEELNPRLKLSEVVPGSGGLHGSLALNDGFEKKVRDLVGDDQFSRLKEPGKWGASAWSHALNEFDKHIKTAYDGNSQESFPVCFPRAHLQPDHAAKLDESCWEMTGEVLQDIFEPLIKHILELLEDQVQRALTKRGQDVRAIFLVGGFGASHYLEKRCVEVYERRGIEVIQPPDGWEAIARGAVLSRLPEQPTIISTLAPRHYGVQLWVPLQDEEDDDKEVRWDDAEGIFLVRKLCWFIHMGDTLTRTKPLKKSGYQNFRYGFSQSELIFYESLYFYETPEAPEYPGPDVEKCCSMKVDLTGIKRKDLPTFTGNNRKKYYRLNYKLVLCTADANLKFSVEFQGREMGSVEATYV